MSDVTELNIKDEKVYLSPKLDLYKQEIISYKIHRQTAAQHGDRDTQKRP